MSEQAFHSPHLNFQPILEGLNVSLSPSQDDLVRMSDVSASIIAPSPEEILLAAERTAVIESTLEERLLQRERLVIEARNRIGKFEHALTYREIGEKCLGLSGEQARQIEKKALHKLRLPGNPLRIYFLGPAHSHVSSRAEKTLEPRHERTRILIKPYFYGRPRSKTSK